MNDDDGGVANLLDELTELKDFANYLEPFDIYCIFIRDVEIYGPDVLVKVEEFGFGTVWRTRWQHWHFESDKVTKWATVGTRVEALDRIVP